jgi:hypothetical protein
VIAVIQFKPLRFRDLIVLVVSGEQNEGRVITQPLDSLLRLDLDAGDEVVVRRVLTAPEHEILPDEQTEFVADVVEHVGLVYP